MTSQYSPQDKQEFINCELAFKCTKDWFELEPTDKAGIKYCNQCEEDVHLCTTQEELDDAMKHKYCVAFIKNPSQRTWFKLSREKCEMNARNLNFESQMTIGYRYPRGDKKLKTFLDEE